jgi:hypothetical protein
MNDGIMYTWDVVSSDVGTIVFRCAKQETANYLRQWCEAEEYNRFLNSRSKLSELLSDLDFDRMSLYLDKFFVVESEVIL